MRGKKRNKAGRQSDLQGRQQKNPYPGIAALGVAFEFRLWLELRRLPQILVLFTCKVEASTYIFWAQKRLRLRSVLLAQNTEAIETI